MTDEEWARLAPMLRRARGAGRPSADLRRRWDAIFWVACSRQPWHALPAALGKADTAHRALRRAARTGLLNGLLIAVSDHPVFGGLDALRWRICRACRRVARLLTMGQLLMAERLGLRDALPCDPWWLPKPHLSEGLT
ncbi:transposase [Falsiroseomonas oryzae]|uniref:transposase n=1 Tax=Falsiroseomonas oryzae TaxID=2766473 RepID=UPI0022EAB4D9|nr:transposase [Roseomonas sp. MO-31]